MCFYEGCVFIFHILHSEVHATLTSTIIIYLNYSCVSLRVLFFCSTGRAYGNLGLSHESLGNFEQAVRFQEQHLGIAAQMNDNVAKTLAYSSLGQLMADDNSYVECGKC